MILSAKSQHELGINIQMGGGGSVHLYMSISSLLSESWHFSTKHVVQPPTALDVYKAPALRNIWSHILYAWLPFLFISAWQPIVYFPFISSAQFKENPSLNVLIPLTAGLFFLQIDFQRKDRCALWCWLVQQFVLVPCHMIHNWSKVGGSVELNRLKALMVSVKNPLHAVTVRVLNVAILREKNQKHEQ